MFTEKQGKYAMWGIYVSILCLGMALYALGKGLSLINPILDHMVKESFFSMELHHRSNFFRSTGLDEYSGHIAVFGILAYGLHLLIGLCFKRTKWFVWIWLAAAFLMTLQNLLSLFGTEIRLL